MSSTTIGNLLLALSVVAASTAQIFIKKVSSSLPPNTPALESLQLLLTTSRFWPAMLAGLLTVGGFLCWVLSLQRLPLSYAYPLACSSALGVALLSVLFLGEAVSWRLVLGTVLITIGAALVVAQSDSFRVTP